MGCLDGVALVASLEWEHGTAELCQEEPAGAGEPDYLSSGSFCLPWR